LKQQAKYKVITKTRPEYFGGIIFRERPAFVAQVNEVLAKVCNINETVGRVYDAEVFSAPLDVHLALTTKCNLFCRGCYNTCRSDKPQDIPLEKAKAIIDKLAELNVFSVSFGGGEPTLHPDILEIAEYARSKRILPNLTTNGLTMNEYFATSCQVFGNVHFSIHKLADMEHVFPAALTYRRITKNKPGLNLLLTSETVTHLDEIVRRAKQSGINKVLFLRYKVTKKNKDIQGLAIDEKMKDLPDLLRRLKKRNPRLMFLLDCSLFEVLAEQKFFPLATYYRFDNNGCQGGNAYLAIDIAGNYKPCSFWPQTMGKILDLSFENWQTNTELQEFRHQQKAAYCSNCEVRKLCGGGCRLLYRNLQP